VSGRGRRAALPAAGHARPEYLAGNEQGGLTVRHCNREGRVREYDFAVLPVAAPMQASLAALFAARCAPGRWSAHRSSETGWFQLRRFAAFLAAQDPAPRDLDELTPAMIRRWRAGLPAGTGGFNTLTMVSALLRDDARLRGGPVAEELARRAVEPRSGTQSYSEADFARITAAARRRFRAALHRIGENGRLLRRWREGGVAEGSSEWTLGEFLDILARTGDMPRYSRNDGQPGTMVYRYKAAITRSGDPATWQRLFLTRAEATAMGVLFLAEFGWNLSVISRLKVPLATPDQGEDGHPVYRVELVKRRQGTGLHHETRNVTDHGAGSPGRLITQALEATRFARAAVEDIAPGTGQLVVWRTSLSGRAQAGQDAHPPVGPFRIGVTSEAAVSWAKSEGLGGSPFLRGRRTVIALDRREPAQHSQDTHDRRYVLPDERVRAEAVEVIAAGAEDAAGRARRAVLVAELRAARDPGAAETATADCADPAGSPWPAADGTCGASFLMCLACPNARVHPGHHPRLACLHEALAGLRSVLPPAAGAAGWRDVGNRLEDLRDRIGAGPWRQALAGATGADRDLVGHLLTGSLDA
jgi:hypothetical protein